MIVRANGIGGTTGDQLATCKPLQGSSAVWYVNSTGGVDAASPAGKDRQKPLATIGQAFTNAAAGDIIVLMDGHDETLTATLTLSKAIDIIGEGLSGGIPTAKLRINAANLSLINVTATGVRIRNVKFPASVQSNVGPGGNVGKINLAGASAVRCHLYGCYIEQGAFDQLPGVSVATGASDNFFENTTWISTATVVATRPTYGLYFAGTGNEIDVIGCTFSDGTVGFSGAAWDASTGIITRLRALGISLLQGADVIINASTTGWFNAQTATNGGRLEW